MKSIIELIEMNARGSGVHPLDYLAEHYIRVESPSSGYMRLVVEYIGLGPRGLDCISVAHYYDQNGDACSDPEMTFEVVREAWTDPKYWGPVTFQMSGSGIYKQAVGRDGDKVRADFGQVRDNNTFTKLWNKNIREQGFIGKFREQLKGDQ